ncbi:ribonuclease catalytic domain-containing protein [Altericista sp. CCNU0014]|uniref:ribonuclease catalytic domain-containing protein n=1 Tax=Altericista sp. CCNU0014 TaxID=3082949 RepID=UPI00385053BA
MDKGTLVEFRGQGDTDAQRSPRLGVAERPEGKKNWIVVDERGHSHSLHPRQITFTASDRLYGSSDITPFLKAVEVFLDPSSLEIAWEILIEEGGRAVEPKELAQLLFSEQTVPCIYAAHRLLSEDKLYFKQKGDLYEPRTAAQVAELKHQIEREAQRQSEQKAFFERWQQALAGEPVEWQSGDRPYLTALERYALFAEESPTRSTAADLLKQIGRPDSPQSAFQVLVDLGLWSHHENLFVRRSNLPTQFSESVLSAVRERLTMPPPDLERDRRDLTHLKVYTIDDESTAEIDDGLSLETLENGRQRVWIHIADPSRWIDLGDDLDKEAQRRSTTVYLPTGMIPMFPVELSTGPMSLIQGQLCCALSFGVILSDDGAVESYEITASTIKPTYRLTYEDVDEILELGVQAEPELIALSAWAERRQAWRMGQGAIAINMPESVIKVNGDDIDILVLEDSRSRNLVAEMMILAGEVAASYGQVHSLPLPFRSQPQPELPPEEELMQLEAGPVRSSAIRRCMPRSEMGIVPARHSSLGLEGYCQVTSPIRRYADLLAHFQIKAHLRGEPLPFSATDLPALLSSITTVVQESNFIERQTNRYWSLEFLRRQGNTVWSAMMLRWLREHESLGLILIEDLGLELAMRFHRSIDLGERLQVRVISSDPRMDRIVLEEYYETTASVSSSP